MKKNKGAERSKGQPAFKRNCPFVNDPFDYCYCSSTNSLNIKLVLAYCGGDFESCDIYKNYIKANKRSYK